MFILKTEIKSNYTVYVKNKDLKIYFNFNNLYKLNFTILLLKLFL